MPKLPPDTTCRGSVDVKIGAIPYDIRNETQHPLEVAVWVQGSLFDNPELIISIRTDTT